MSSFLSALRKSTKPSPGSLTGRSRTHATVTDPPAFPGDEVPANCLRVSVPGAAAMRDLGARLASLLRPGDLVVLSGSLGAGKTTLVQGIATGLDVPGPITPPTFVVPRVHPSLPRRP